MKPLQRFFTMASSCGGMTYSAPISDATAESLVPLSQAVASLARQHEKAGTRDSWPECQTAALHAIVRRLADGAAIAFGGGYSLICNAQHGGLDWEEGCWIDDWQRDDEMSCSEFGVIPAEFWQRFRENCSLAAFDPVACDVTFAVDSAEERWSGSAWEILVTPDGLPGQIVLEESKDARSGEPAGKRGRRPANWWPDFAAELALYIHEMGIPAGHGTDGQSEVIDAVFGRMSAQGKSEGSRAQVQSAVNEVLVRIRSAGK